MCFSIPYKVLKVIGNTAYLEGGARVRIGKDMKVKQGSYVQVTGQIVVDSLSETKGERIRQLIKSLNTYESKN